ncbi:hypothetical protein BWQ96_06605 [Gracilariopsis chorda]|uniref:C3HC-type domain-containing protein n=1 Tax=Gracilariopsis chorda TaxID=448386 RepID=A0A2V3INI9_9FLOR|nr:hypothetical protein BWQ96_06605 [Gracilariopsis chorda]|eukprot:PXF43646.1 hypothetical protein BWQ96_06605 [Gracilariopsis chorda]
MVPENEDAVEKVAQPDLENLPQPDTDPGVIDVDDEGIDVDGDGEEEDECKGEENAVVDDAGSTINLVTPPPDARVQKDVDVIDLEEADEEGVPEGDAQVDDEDGEAQTVGGRGTLEEDGEDSDIHDASKGNHDDGEEDEGTPRVDASKDESGDEILPVESDGQTENVEHEIEHDNPDNQKGREALSITPVENQQHEARPQLVSNSGVFANPSEQTEQDIGEETVTEEIAPLPDEKTKDTEKSEHVPSESQKLLTSVEKVSRETTEAEGGPVQHPSSTVPVTEANERAAFQLFSAVRDDVLQTTSDATNDANGQDPGAVEPDEKDNVAQIAELAPTEPQESRTLAAKESREEGLDAEHLKLSGDMKPQESSSAADSETGKAQKVADDAAGENEVDETQEAHSKSEGVSDLEDGDDEEVVEEDNMDMDADLTDDEPVQDEQPNTLDRKPEKLESSKTDTEFTEDNQTVENDANKVDDSQVLTAKSENNDAVHSEKHRDMEIVQKDVDDGSGMLAINTKDQLRAVETVDEVHKTNAPDTEVVSHGDTSFSEKSSLSNNKLEGKPTTAATAESIRDEGEAQEVTDSNSKMDIDTPSKDMSFKGSANTNLTAPLFGMQTMELPKFPVSFSSPPSFQRSRLSPSAPPFIPAAHRDANRAATPQTELDSTSHMDVDSSRTEDKPTEQLKTMLAPAFKESAARGSQLKPEKICPPSSASPPSVPHLSSAKVSNPPVPQTAGVSQSVAPGGIPQSEKDSFKEESKAQERKVTFGSIETITVPKADSRQSPTRPAQDSISGSEPRVDEQELKDEETDEGSMYEVSHVPISVRIGNGTAIKRDSLSTLRLAISKSGEAKLEMFKEAASSLLLFESLSNTRNTIRIRKVAKRTVMTVTLMTNNNGGAQVAKKYYVHLGKHIYDKLFNIFVIHLNEAGPARPVQSAPLNSSGKRAAPSSGSDAEGTKSVPGKRSLEVTDKKDPKRVKVAERRRQLLETKAKLLENLKAVRKNKAGTGVKDHPATGKSLKRTAATPVPPPSLSTSSQLKPSVSTTPRSTAPPSGASSTPAPPATTIQGTASHSDNPSTIAHGFDSTALKTPNKNNTTKDETAVGGQAGISKLKSGQPLQAPSTSTRGKRPRPEQQLHRLQPGQNQSTGQESNNVKKMRVTEEKAQAAASVSNPNMQGKLKFLRDRARRGGYGGSAATPVAGRRDPTESDEVKNLRILLNEKISSQTEAEKQKLEAMKGMATAKEETKMAKEDAMKTLEALSKANEEVTKRKSEVSKLLDERKEMENVLTAKRAESELSSRQKNELSAEVSKLLKHMETVLAAGSPRENLNKESFSRCDHNNVSDFFDRLHSFKPSTWPVMEDSDIGARACARHGWYNSDVDVLRSTDGVELRLRDLYDDVDVHLEEVQRVTTALVQEHQFLSGWRGKQCARDIGKELLDRETLIKNVSEIQKHDVKKRVRGFGERADRLCELIAACGWKPHGKAVRCEWCGIVAVGDLHLRESHYKFCMFAEEQDEVRRNIELLGLDWEVEGDRLGWFFRSSYGDVVDAVQESVLEEATKDDGGDIVMAG